MNKAFGFKLIALTVITAIFSVEIAWSKPKSNIAPQEKTVSARDFSTSSVKLETSTKISALKAVNINALPQQLGHAVSMGTNNPTDSKTYGLAFFKARTNDTKSGHASFLYEDNGNVSVWYEANPNKYYIVGCKVAGKGRFILDDAFGSKAIQDIDNEGEVILVVKPHPQLKTRRISLSSQKTSYLANWIFYGCELTPLEN